MDDISIRANILSEDPKSEQEVKNALDKISEFIQSNFSDIVQFKFSHNHVSTETTTPDGKFKIGNLYKFPRRNVNLSGLLVGIFPNDDGNLHLSFMIGGIENPTMLESNLGLSDPERLVSIDDYYINPDSTLGYFWSNNEFYSYLNEHKPLEVELIKETDKKEFTEFYKKYVLD